MDISFEDYARDMEELSSSGAGIIRKLRKDIRERDRMIVALVLAGGGSLSVPCRDMDAADLAELTVERDPYGNLRLGVRAK